MGKFRDLTPHIANANGRLDRFAAQINQAVQEARSCALSKLQPKLGIDIIFTDAFDDIIPETHIGGHTYASDFIAITLDSTAKNIKTSDIFQTICHETAHAIRWQYNDEWSHRLFDAIVFEGLATAFEIQSAEDNGQTPNYFADKMLTNSDESNQKIWKVLKNHLASDKYNYTEIFFTGNKKANLSRWAGYSLGYYFIKKYTDTHKQTIDEVFAEKYSVFWNDLIESK